MHTNVIKHFLATNLDLILKKSLINCHVVGVDSVLFDDTPRSRIRLFVANENHELWKNYFPPTEELSVAFHSHHCDLVLSPVIGEFINIVIEQTKPNKSPKARWLTGYKHQSKINTGECKFVCGGYDRFFKLKNIEQSYAYDGDDIVNVDVTLAANELHTIYVSKGQFAAWFVFEEAEDPDYDSTCYSNVDLTKFDDSQLYKHMNESYLRKLIERVFGIDKNLKIG